VKDEGVLVVVLGQGRSFHLLFLMNFLGLSFVLLGVKIELVWKLGRVLLYISINNSLS
jgi:hypothetical protein